MLLYRSAAFGLAVMLSAASAHALELRQSWDGLEDGVAVTAPFLPAGTNAIVLPPDEDRDTAIAQPLPEAPESSPPAAQAQVPALPADQASLIREALTRLIQAPEPGQRSPVALTQNLREALQTFYAARDFTPAFATETGFGETARRVLARFAEARRDGLDPGDYTRAGLLVTGSTAEAIAQRELAFADVLLAYARHASGGRVDPSRVDARHVTVRPPFLAPSAVLQDMASTTDADGLLSSFHPQHAGFQALRNHLAAALDAQTTRPPALSQRFPQGPALRSGMADPRVAMLRQRLSVAARDGGDVMDAALVSAVRAFQSSRGLDVTGIVGPQTVRALNADISPPVDRRIADLTANMERWRWLPRELGNHHVWVNIPEYLVRVRSSGATTYEGRVVVGKLDTPTPVFSDEMQYLVVNPSWTVPPTLVRTQMMPLLQSDPAALARRGIEVVRNRNGGVSFRQPPGERNALGRVKFMFPNNHAVYLHDTPARAYFGHTRRAYSAGCVRVEHPGRFADAAFSNEENINGRRIEGLYGPSERTLRLRTRFPVHLVYFTNFVQADGTMGSAEDIYGFHSRLKELLDLI
jgi:L,D-transpeptidase YcbB